MYLDDPIINYLSRTKNKIIKKKTFPVRYKIIKSNSRKAIFFYHGWGGSSSHFKYLSNRLRKNFNIVLLDYPLEIISTNPDKTLKYYNRILDLTKEAIKRLEKKGVTKFYSLGSSLGGYLAVFVANNTKEFDKIVLSCSGNSLSKGMWESIALKRIAQKLEKKGYPEEKLIQLWNKIEPENNLHNLKACKFLYYQTKFDRLVQYRFQKGLSDLFIKNKIKHKIIVNKLFGHYITILISLFDYKTIKNFYEND